MGRPTKQSALAVLTQARLGELAADLGLDAPRRTTKGALVDLLAAHADLAGLLDGLKRDDLKDICRAHGLDDGGREKSAIRDRILAAATPGPEAEPAPESTPGQLTMIPTATLGLRRVLESLPDDALVASGRHFGFAGEQPRPHLITAMVESGLVPLRELFEEIPLDVLQSLARSHGIDGRVRTRDRLVESLLALARHRTAPAPAPALRSEPLPPVTVAAPEPPAAGPRRPSERSTLAVLTRERLVELARVFGVAPSPRATRDEIVENLLGTARPTLADILGYFKRDELRAACTAHALPAEDRARTPLVERILVARGEAPAPASATSPEHTPGVPRPGDIVRCRHRNYLVEGVTPPPDHRQATLVKLTCLDDDAPGRSLVVLWELELGAQVVRPEAGALGGFTRLDDPRHFAAYLHAIKWNGVTATDAGLFQAPFRAGIALSAYQLTPLMKALELPRANLFIADDVGLGKTIEAGLVLQELLLRQRVDYILIVCPASVCLQWQEEMRRRFGLHFEVHDRAFVARRRRQRGFAVNPWETHNRFIISYPLLRRPEYLEPLTAHLKYRGRKKTLLILDEAHTIAPASPATSARYSVDSKVTKTVRDGLAGHFENRLFLSATPHNGHSNSFSALLEILDPQRFTRGVKIVGAAQLQPIMVRRLKRDIRQLVDRDIAPLPERRVIEMTLVHESGRWTAHDDERGPRFVGEGRAVELELAALLAEYTALVAPESKRARLVLINLQKRLLSSIPAFLRTLGKHARSFDISLAPALTAADAQQSFELTDDDVDPTDDSLAAADDAEVESASRELQTPVGRARALLEQMTRLATEARGEPDARVLALVEWIRVHMCPAAGFTRPSTSASLVWNDRRVLVFTESIDTQRWLKQLLSSAFRHTDRGDERILEIRGGMPDDVRDEVQRAFNGAPCTCPVRVLLATDAAREGINLQAHCADLFHFDIPWNPARMEQRNGRIDRTLQPAPIVRCHYFRYRDRPADHVLATVIRKVETIQAELGSLGTVIHGRLADLLESEGISSDTLARVDRAAELGSRGERVKAELEPVRTDDVKAIDREIKRASQMLARSRKILDFDSGLLRDTLDVALERLGHGRLTSNGDGAWTLPPLPDTWAGTLDNVRTPRGRDEHLWDWRRRCPPQPVVFEAPKVMTDAQVHLHLHHPFVRRIMDGFLAQGFGAHELQRITVVRDPKAGEVRVLAFGRLSLFGRGAVRLHDVLVPVVAGWDSDTGPRLGAGDSASDEQAVADLETLLARPDALKPISTSRQKDIIRRATADFSTLWPAVRDEADTRGHEAEQKLRQRGQIEAEQLRGILTAQRDAIRKTLAAAQLELDDLVSEAERAQFTDDRDHMQGRLAAIDRELAEEPADLQALYDVQLRRLEPVGLVYLWPEMMA